MAGELIGKEFVSQFAPSHQRSKCSGLRHSLLSLMPTMGRTPKGLQRCSRFRRGHRRRSLSGRSNDWLVCDMMRHKRLSLPCQLYQHDLLSARPRAPLRIPHALRIVSRGLWMARPSGHHLSYWLQRMEACRHPDRHVLTSSTRH